MRSLARAAGVILLILGALSVPATADRDEGRGTWRGRISPEDDRIFEVDLRWTYRGGILEESLNISVSSLEGFDGGAFGSWGAPLEFSWPRKSGTIRFTGKGRWFWMPSGEFNFEPTPEFVEKIRTLDEDSELYSASLIRIALHDISLEFVDELATLGYAGVDLEEALRLNTYGLDFDHVRRMQALGYRPSIDELIRMENHNITAERIEQFAKLEMAGIPVEDHVRLKSHGVSPEWMRKVVTAGIPASHIDSIIRLRNFRVKPEELSAYMSVKQFSLDADDIVRLHTQQIPPDFFAAVAASGLREIHLETVIRAWQQRIPADYLKAMVEFGFVELDDVARFRNNRVSLDLVRALKENGYDSLAADDVIRLRNHSIGPDFIRELAEAGYDDLSVSELVEIKTRGVGDLLTRRKGA